MNAKLTPTTCQPTLISSEPLSVLQLSLLCNEIADEMKVYRPEFTNLVRLHRNCGCRVKELFQPERWQIVNNNVLQVQPQKGNALRILQLQDIGYQDANAFQPTLNDMRRLPFRQYERAFKLIADNKGLWRLYDDGFAQPSTHLFRHVKIKELAAAGYDLPYIGTWIGEKNIANLNYYLGSKYYI